MNTPNHHWTILPFNDLYDLSLGTFMFKQVNKMAPIVMDDTVYNRDIHSYFTRSAQNVHTTFRRTVKVAKGFLNKESQYYYDLPVNITGVRTYGTFKKCSKITSSLKPGLNIIVI